MSRRAVSAKMFFFVTHYMVLFIVYGNNVFMFMFIIIKNNIIGAKKIAENFEF